MAILKLRKTSGQARSVLYRSERFIIPARAAQVEVPDAAVGSLLDNYGDLFDAPTIASEVVADADLKPRGKSSKVKDPSPTPTEGEAQVVETVADPTEASE
jgi:hypothetical protein